MKTKFFLLPCLFLAPGLPLPAVTVTWDNSDGTDAWSTPANWDTNTEPTSTNDVAFPLGLAGGITLAGTENANTLAFLDDYTLSGGTSLTLASASSISVDSGHSVTISTATTAPGTWTKLGDGTLILSVSNTFAAGTQVNAGILRANATGALGVAGSVTTVNTGATLEIGGITLDRPMTLNTGTTLRAVASNSTSNGVHTVSNAASTTVTLSSLNSTDVLAIGTVTNDLTGGATDTLLIVNGPGAVRSGAASNYAGNWRVDAGKLQAGLAASLGATAGGTTTLNGGTLAARVNAATTFTGPVNLIVTADSALESDRTSAGAGSTHTFGTLEIAGQTLSVSPGANATSGTATVVVGNVTLTGNPVFAVGDVGATNGKLSTGSLLGGGVARAITKTGAGDLAFTGGATDLIAGSTISVSGGGALEGLYATLGSGTPLTPTATQSPFGEATLGISGSTLRLAIDGENSSTAQTFATGLAPSFSGASTLEVDRRSIGSSKTISFASSSLASGTVLGISANNSFKTTITGTTTLAGDATIQGTSGKTTTLTLGAISESAPSTLTFGGASSTHTANLTAASGHSGGTNVKGGTINMNITGALGSGALLIENETVSSAAKLVVASGVTLAGIPSLTMNSGTLEMNNLAATSGIPLDISGGNLWLRSNTSDTLSNGGLIFDGGSPTITVGNSTSGSSQTLNIGPLTLRNAPVITLASTNAFSLTFGPLLLESDVTLSVNNGVTARTSVDPNGLVAGVRESGGAWKIIKAGTGTLELAGDSTLTGGLDLNAGTVLIKNASGAGSGTITVGDGVTNGTLLLTSGMTIANAITHKGGSIGHDNTTTGNATFNGPVTLLGTLDLANNTTLANAGAEAVFTNTIAGAFDLTKSGGGIVTLQNSGNNFGTGTATSISINAGTLAVNSDAALGHPGNGLAFGGTSSSPALRADASFSTARQFTFNNTSGNSGIEVATGSELTITSNFAGATEFTKLGAGTLTLGPAVDNSARGAAMTSVTAGTLRMQTATAVSASGGIALGQGARLELLSDANTTWPNAITRSSLFSPASVIHVDRASGGIGSNGRHTVPSLALTSQLHDFEIQGGNGYGLTITSLGTSGGTVTNNAPGEMRVGSMASTNTTAQTFITGGIGNVVIQGAATQGTGVSSLRKTGAGTMTLGTSHGWTGALQCYEGLLDLNGLNVTASGIGMGLGAAQSTSTINTNGGSITLTGNVTYDESGSGVTEQGQSTINGSLNLGAATRTFTLDDSSQAVIDMEINGVISGDPGAGLTKSGVGTLRLSGTSANTYDGLTTVTAGTLELNKTGVPAIGNGGLSILNTNTSVVRQLQVGQITASAPVVVGNGIASATLDLNNFATTLDNPSLGGINAVLRVGSTGTLTLGGNLTFENGTSTYERNMVITSTGDKNTPASGGTLDLGGSVRTITVNNASSPSDPSPVATIETSIINGGILKTGSAGLVLAHPANTFTSGLVVAQGLVYGAGAGSFGTLPMSLTAGAGQTAVLGVDADAVNLTQAISTSGSGTNVLRYDGPIDTTATFSGAITLGSGLTFDVTNGEVDENDTALMIVSGVLDDGAGSFGITKTGFGTTRLTQPNTFDGPVAVTSGRLAFSDINALGTNTTITMNGGVLEAEADVTTTRGLDFTSDSTLRASTVDVGFELNGPVTLNNHDIGFIGRGQIVLSNGGGGSGDMKIGTYTNAFGTVTTNKLTGNFGVLSTRGGFVIPGGNILIDKQWVWELTSDMTRALGTGPGEIQMPSGSGAGFAAHGADRTVNLGGAGATVTWGSGLFLVSGTAEGSLLFGCPSATHTLHWMNPISMDNADTTPYLDIYVFDGAAALEAVMHGPITFTGAGQGGVEFIGGGTMHVNGLVSGKLDLYTYESPTVRLAGGCDVTGDVILESGTMEIPTGTSLGGGSYIYIDSTAELDLTGSGLTLASSNTGYMEINGTLTGSALAPGDFYGFGTVTGDFTTAATSIYYNDPDIGLTAGGNLTLDGGMTMEIAFNSASLGTGYSMITAGGTVAIGGTLVITFDPGTTIASGATLKLINKTSPGAVTGTFSGLAEGATVTASTGEIFTISYIGGDGNDVVLIAPGSSTAATITGFTVSPGSGAETGLTVFDMTATGTPGAIYRLEACDNLLDWSTVQTITADGLTGALVFHVTQSPLTFPKRFFRIASP